MNYFVDAVHYLTTSSNWHGPTGLSTRILEHLHYSLIAVVVAAVIAIPLGMIVGHTGRGSVAVVGTVNALRSLPTLGVLLLGVLLWGIGLIPPTVALVLLGLPPLLAGTYSGIRNVDPAVVEAARSLGMSELRILFRVEIPNAAPLIVGGLRSATLQIIATTTVAAYASLGGLGRLLIDGISSNEYEVTIAGSIAVTILAVLIDTVLAGAQWAVAPGTGRLKRVPADLKEAISKRHQEQI